MIRRVSRAGKIEPELGWYAAHGFDDELTAMIDGYLDNDSLWYPLGEARYAGERFGKIGS